MREEKRDSGATVRRGGLIVRAMGTCWRGLRRKVMNSGSALKRSLCPVSRELTCGGSKNGMRGSRQEAVGGPQAKDGGALDQGLSHGGGGRGGIWDSALPGLAGHFNMRKARGRDGRCFLSRCVIRTPSLRWIHSRLRL